MHLNNPPHVQSPLNLINVLIDSGLYSPQSEESTHAGVHTKAFIFLRKLYESNSSGWSGWVLIFFFMNVCMFISRCSLVLLYVTHTNRSCIDRCVFSSLWWMGMLSGGDAKRPVFGLVKERQIFSIAYHWIISRTEVRTGVESYLRTFMKASVRHRYLWLFFFFLHR